MINIIQHIHIVNVQKDLSRYTLIYYDNTAKIRFVTGWKYQYRIQNDLSSYRNEDIKNAHISGNSPKLFLSHKMKKYQISFGAKDNCR